MHPLNGICPYFTMFPLAFPLGVLEAAQPGDGVLDPFCGRGSTNFAARLLNLPSLGIDSNPVAVASAQAKLINVTPSDVITIAQSILEEVTQPHDVPAGEFWSLAYHPDTLLMLCRLREGLLRETASPSRTGLRALILGALHGPRAKSQPSYFSNQSQRTYAPKPNYSVRFWTDRGLEPPKVDVLSLLERRAHRYFSNLPQPVHGRIVQGDSRQPGTLTFEKMRFRWIVTSPPYYGLRTYLPDQWLRAWFLGGPPSVEYSSDGQLVHTGAERFARELAAVWRNAATVATDDARLVVRFGAINDRRVDPLELLDASFMQSGWTVLERKSAGTAAQGRRQARHATSAIKPALEEFDVTAIRTS